MIKRKLDESILNYDERRDVITPGNHEETIDFTAKLIINLANEEIDNKGIFTLALSGGSTPKALFEKLTDENHINKINWKKVLLFWSDERCVPATDPESNYKMAMEAGFSKTSIPENNIFRMEAEKNVEEASNKYENLIKEKVPNQSFDLVLLGMGNDGHTASLFPKTHALHVENKLVVPNYIPDKEVWRMTLTYECINASKNIFILVTGKNKASILDRVFHTGNEPDSFPIHRIGTEKNKALWITDREAVSQYEI